VNVVNEMETRVVLIVGSGLAGWRTATELRRLGHKGVLTVLGAEQELPYDRPPLSKRVLAGVDDPSLTRLAGADTAAANGIALRLGARVATIGESHVELADGEQINWDELVIATGADPRRPAWVPVHPRVHLLRTLSDSLRLAEAMRAARSLVVIGGGFIGAEVAATARGLGLKVVLVELAPTIAHAAVGAQIGELLDDLHRSRGVDLRTSEAVSHMTTTSDEVVVTTASGTEIVADLAVVGLGVTPAVGILATRPDADLTNGIACDPDGRVEGWPGVWAVGDVARWRNTDGSEGIRREHWSSASDQAAAVAHGLLGLPVPPHLRTPPYVWSDQYDVKLQAFGRPDLADDGDWLVHQDGYGVWGHTRQGDLVAVVGVGTPRMLGAYRRAITANLTPA